MRHKAIREPHRCDTSSANPFRMFPDNTAARKNIEEIVWPGRRRCPHGGTDNGMPRGGRL